jgi:hypothetical protein
MPANTTLVSRRSSETTTISSAMCRTRVVGRQRTTRRR